MQGIGGLSVESCTILERVDAVFCIVEKSVVAGTTAETAVHACVPSLWISDEACVASAG